jgi:hypothetical protein
VEQEETARLRGELAAMRDKEERWELQERALKENTDELADQVRCTGPRARSHCRFLLTLIHSIPDPLTCSVPLFLKRQRERTLGDAPEAGDLAVQRRQGQG